MTILSNSHKFIFIHLHKCGGTSVEQAYSPYSSWNDLILGGTVFGEFIDSKYNEIYGLHKHSSVIEITNIVKDYQAYDFITVVRHPLERLKSLYKWVKRGIFDWCLDNNIDIVDLKKLILNEEISPEFMKWEPFYLFIYSNEIYSFNEYVNAIYNHIPEWYPKCDNALTPMIESIAGIRMKQIFKLEEVNYLWTWMEDRISADITPLSINSSDTLIDSSLNLHLDMSVHPDGWRNLCKM